MRTNQYCLIDSTIVKAHQQSAGPEQCQAIGGSHGGLTTKIDAAVDAPGNPTGFHLTPGQAHDLQGADVLPQDTPGASVIADKAYDAQQGG